MEDYAELRRQVIDVDDDNDSAPQKIPQTNNTTTTATRTSETEFNWTGAEGIVCPRLARNLTNTPACFNNYSNEDIMKMSKINLFLTNFCIFRHMSRKYKFI